MRKVAFGAAAILLAISFHVPAGSARDTAQGAIDSRKALMQANGAAAALAGAMLKGDKAYDPAAAKAVIATMRAVALSFPAHVPEGSHGEGSTAAPAIWEKPDEFHALIDKLKTDTAAAVEASGKDGPADLAAMQAVVQPILADCRTCHEQFRLSR